MVSGATGPKARGRPPGLGSRPAQGPSPRRGGHAGQGWRGLWMGLGLHPPPGPPHLSCTLTCTRTHVHPHSLCAWSGVGTHRQLG